MSGFVPKINVGKPVKRQSHNLSADNSTSLNFGVIQPTFCREMIPHTEFKVKTHSVVNLAPMPLPTWGNISLYHKHVFVPYSCLWEPFEAFLSQNSFSYNGVNFMPNTVPYFKNVALLHFLLNYSDVCIVPDTSKLDEPLIFDSSESEQDQLDLYAAYWYFIRQTTDWFGQSSYKPFQLSGVLLDNFSTGCLCFGSKYASPQLSDVSLIVDDSPKFMAFGISGADMVLSVSGGTTPTQPDVDPITISNFYLCFRFKPCLKLLRSIFIGLGYEFNPTDISDQPFNILKLLAFYKACFDSFAVQRDIQWQETNAAKLISKINASNGSDISAPLSGTHTLWHDFILDLMQDCFYTFSNDYFGMSVSSYGNVNNLPIKQVADSLDIFNPVNVNYRGAQAAVNSNNRVSSVSVNLALKLQRFVNKNSVIGKKISDYLKVHYGINETEVSEYKDVTEIGTTKTNVYVGRVVSTAVDDQGRLGTYAGVGTADDENEQFTFDSRDSFGCWITLSYIVPNSSYGQGVLHENMNSEVYDFGCVTFDALGYEPVHRAEITQDFYAKAGSFLNPNSQFGFHSTFGHVPRYSHYKVGHDIINGDISLPSLRNQNAPFTLNRLFGAYGIDSDGTIAVPYMPQQVTDGFRQLNILSDNKGNFNRIFNYTDVDVDHFYLNLEFNVEALSPLESLKNSFDTIDSNEAEVSVEHS